MLKTVTLDTFRDAIAAEQKPFSGIPTLPTFFGILALTIVIIDTYLNTIGKNGFSVFLINSIFGSTNYLYLFFSVLILQLSFIFIAFKGLRHLRSIPWSSPISYANQSLNDWLVNLVFITLAMLASWNLSHTIFISSNFETIAEIPGNFLEIILTSFVCIAIIVIAKSFTKALRYDSSLSIGIIFGIIICAVSYILVPSQVQVIIDLQKVRDNIISEQTATTITGLKVRENPGSQSSKLGEISTGDLVTLLGKEAQTPDGGTWVLISNNNTKGWVNKKFLSINPPLTKLSKTTNSSSERVYLSEVNQFRYWQFGIFLSTIISFTLFFLLIKFSNTTDEIIFQLDLDKDETNTSFYEYSPSGLALTAPIYVKILAQNQLIIAFSRGINSNTYNLLDIRNNQRITPLHDGSIIIWNISKIKERINESFSTVDTLNFFSFTGSIGFLTTTISYHDQSRNFNQLTIDFISEILFKKSNDLQNIVKGALYSTFEEHVSPLRIDINEISSEVDTFNLFEVNIDDTKYQSGYKNYKQEELKDIQYKAQNLKDKINANIKSLKDIRNKTGGYAAADLANRIVDRIIINISDRIAQIGLSGDFINETKRIFLMLGFRVSEANLKILDTNCENKLRELQQKIEDRLKEIKKEYDAARIKEEEDDKVLYTHWLDVIVKILENPLLGREEKFNIIKAIPYRRAMEIYRNITHDDPSEEISKPQPKTFIQIENDDNTEGPT